MKAFGDKLILKRKVEEAISAGGIITSATEKPKMLNNHGIVVAIGDKALGDLGKVLKKTVLFTNGVLVNLDDEEHIMVSSKDIYAVL